MNSKEHVGDSTTLKYASITLTGEESAGKFRTADVMTSHACRSWALRGNLVALVLLLLLVVIFALPREIVIGTAQVFSLGEIISWKINVDGHAAITQRVCPA